MFRKNIFWISLIIISLFAISWVTFNFISSGYRQMVVVPRQPTPILQPTATPTPDPDRPISILLLGYGGANHDGGSLTDSIMVAEIKPKESLINLISIPRDLWIELPIGTSEPHFAKVNTAYAIGLDDRRYPQKPVEFTGPAGGGQMVKSIIGQVIGKTIDFFIAVDFQGFTKAVDQLGGIDVKVQRTFTDPFYPLDIGTTDSCGKSEDEIKAITATLSGEKLEAQFPCRYEQLHFDVGTTHLDGTTALKFARSRHSPEDGGDFNRAARQRQVILAVRDKIVSLNFFSKIISVSKTLSSHVRTDIDFEQMEKLLSRAPEFVKYKVKNTALTDQNSLQQSRSTDHQDILIPTSGINNYSAIHELLDKN